MAKKNTDGSKSVSAGILRALAAAFIITAVVFLVYAALITYTNVTEESVQTVVIITTLVSVLTAGIMAAKNAENKGWLYGMGVGVVYAIVMIITGFSLSPEAELGLKTVSTILMSAAGGGIGGMIGINIGNIRK